MKRSSSPSLQFVASAASSTEAATMSSRPPYRGGRNQWRRGFSDRSSGGGNGNGRGQFVTGDSHFRSVRDANRGFRPVEGGNFANQSALQPQPRPPFNPRYPPHFYAPLPFNPGQPFSHPPPFNQNQHFRPPQQFRPRPQKPSDYRNWEFAKPGPPPHCERFTVLSYNILADYLAINHRSKLYFHIPRHMLEWEWRKKNIIFELGLWSADILCFQEVDRFQDLEEELKLRGYSGIWKMRTGDPVDGCAIFWRVSRFKLLHEECIEFNRLGLRDNVAQICVLESLNQTDNKDISALPMSLTGSNKVVICNIHVLYNPKRGEIKLGQIRVLLNRAHAVSKLWDDAPVVLCGDFNCTPKSPIYNYVSEQKLNLSELPRDKVSGQASAEIRPLRQFSPNFRAQSADSPGGASTVLDHREVRQSSPLSDMQEQNNPGSNSVYVPLMISQVNTGMNVSDNSFISGQFGNKNGALSHELTKESHEEVDGCKGETLSTVSVTVSGLKESSSNSQDKGRFLVEQMKDGHESIAEDSHHEDSYSSLIETGLTKDTHQDTVDGLTESATGPQNEGGFSVVESKDGHKFTAVDSRHEDIYPNLIETEHREKLHATSDAQRDLSSEHSQSNLETQDESMNFDKSKLSFLGAKYFADALIDPKPAGAPDSHVSSSELSNETSFPRTLKVSSMGSSEKLSSLLVADDKGIPSTLSEVNVSYASTRFDFTIDEKMENLSFNELVDTNEEGSFGEDCTQFLSELHDTKGSFSSDFTHTERSDFVESDKSFEGSAVPHSKQLHHPADEVLDNDSPGMDPEPIDAVTFSYDPSAWTPMEIETATGNGDCTLMEHSLKLRSTYAEVEDFSGTRDSNGEPLVTSYNRCFLGTVDYIWRSEGLQTVRILAPIPKHTMQWTPGFPTKKWGSDHIALVSELAFTKDVRTQNTEAS